LHLCQALVRVQIWQSVKACEERDEESVGIGPGMCQAFVLLQARLEDDFQHVRICAIPIFSEDCVCGVYHLAESVILHVWTEVYPFD
jgi:hypothetical protein